jgi:hypothetical protein
MRPVKAEKRYVKTPSAGNMIQNVFLLDSQIPVLMEKILSTKRDPQEKST